MFAYFGETGVCVCVCPQLSHAQTIMSNTKYHNGDNSLLPSGGRVSVTVDCGFLQ